MKNKGRIASHGLSVLALATALAASMGCAQAQQATLQIVVQEEPNSLDPCDTNNANNSRVLRNNVYETLVNVDPADGSIKPNLATAWTRVSPTTWRFTLRPGVKFQDGTAFTSDAIVKALDRAQLEPLGCAIRGSKLGKNPFTAKAVDSLTVDVTGKDPDPIIPYRMAILDIGSPAATPADAKTKTPLGTGPYKVASWKPGQELVFAANPDYWGEKPAIASVRFVWRGESAVRTAMVETGEAHLAFGIAPQDATSPKDKTFLNSEETFIRMDTRMAPLDDIRVRRAANLAIDRDAMIGTIFHKQVQKATQMSIPNVNGYSPDIPVWKFDATEAKRLLAAAKADGVPVDKEIVLYGRNGIYPNVTESLEAVQGMLNAVGFKIRVQMMDATPWLQHLLKPFDDETGPNMLSSQSDNTQGDAVFTIGPKFRSDGNQSTLTDPLVDRLIDLGTASTGTLRRNAFRLAYEYMQSEIIPTIDLFYMVGTVRVSDKVAYAPDVQTNNEIKLRTAKFR